MARRCDLLGKKTTSGNNRPFSLKATKRTFRPNLFRKRIFNPLTGRVERMKLSAKAIRTLKKWAREAAADMGITEETTKVAKAGEEKKERVKKEKLTPKQKKELAAQKEAEVLGKGKTTEDIGKKEAKEEKAKSKK